MKRHHLLIMLALPLAGLFAFLALLPIWGAHAQEAPSASYIVPSSLAAEARSTADVDWLEARGLNIVDLVGLVPEEYLEDTIVSYSPGYGIVRYQSGSRVGNTVTITATLYPRYIVVEGGWSGTLLTCLGQPGRFDQVGSVTPATTVRLYHGSTNVTDEVAGYRYVPAGQSWPAINSNYYNRYTTVSVDPAEPVDGALSMPANMGCEMWISSRDYQELTGVFTVQASPLISVSVVGTEVFTFHSYIGPGEAGHFKPLVNQLISEFSNRHEKFELTVPPEADYFLLDFPPMPIDPYSGTSSDWKNPYGNVDRPVGGTYRIQGDGKLSVDHVNTMGLPLYGHWRDRDQSGGTTYLPHFTDPDDLAAPEYFVPAGVDYDPCMIQGNCPSSILNAIHDTEMTMRIVYLRVERTDCTLERIPLRMVGPEWSPGVAASVQPLGGTGVPCLASGSSSATSIGPLLKNTDTLTRHIYLPLALHGFCASVPPDDPTGCPCGWFTPDGRMMDFIPKP